MTMQSSLEKKLLNKGKKIVDKKVDELIQISNEV